MRCAPPLVALTVLAFAPGTAAEPSGLRLALVPPEGGCGGLDPEETVATVGAYLREIPVEVVPLQASLPRAPFDEIRAAVLELARRSEAAVVVWTQCPDDRQVLLHVLDVGGDATLVRTIEIGYQPSETLHRTLAAVVRTVVDSGMLGRAARAEDEPSAPDLDARAGPGSAARVRAGPAWALALGYELRLGEEPAPSHHALGARVWLEVVDWVLVALGGRLGLPAGVPAQDGGSVARAAVLAGAGVGRRLGPLLLGAVAALDMEWLWGEAETGDGRAIAFSHLGLGLALEAVVALRLVRGLELRVEAGLTVRPRRVIFLMHGEEVAASGHLEGQVGLGLGWRFM